LTFAESTEYRRAFGSEKKLDEGEGGGAMNITLATAAGRPTFCPRRPPTLKHLLHANLSNTEIKTHWTTSYMRDFKRPTTAIGLTPGAEAPPPGKSSVEAMTQPAPTPLLEVNILSATRSLDAMTPSAAPSVQSEPSLPEAQIPIRPMNKKTEARSGDSMKKLLRHTNYLPNPISEERVCFDDDASHNPTLKNYIELISRK